MAARFPIEHVIVLMLENRSYDHMLGYLPNGHGLTGDEFNPVNPADPTSEHVRVSNTAEDVTIDPAHDYIDVEKQFYGAAGKIINPAPMNGFVANQIEQEKGDIEQGKKIMECFDPGKVPALATLAREFCLCDRWFSAVPGPTWINRFFVHAATADGMLVDTPKHKYNMKTIYDSLDKKGLPWAIYYGDVPQSIMLQGVWKKLDRLKQFDRFYADIEKGDLSAYTFIEPRFIDFHEWKATDQHPPHAVSMGEYLLAEVYETLRNSPFWQKSLLIVTYDEHGGFFDRVPPPVGVPSPDGKNSKDPSFDFTRLGGRVPAILVSPYVEKGQVDSTVYEHSSLPATLKNLFDLRENLTARDRAANTFEKNLSRSQPRSDTPLTLPVPGNPEESRAQRELMRTDSVDKWRQGKVDPEQASHAPVTHFQASLIELGHLLNQKMGVGKVPKLIQTEHEAAIHVIESVVRFIEH